MAHSNYCFTEVLARFVSVDGIATRILLEEHPAACDSTKSQSDQPDSKDRQRAQHEAVLARKRRSCP
jgi:hypothetical protein